MDLMPQKAAALRARLAAWRKRRRIRRNARRLRRIYRRFGTGAIVHYMSGAALVNLLLTWGFLPTLLQKSFALTAATKGSDRFYGWLRAVSLAVWAIVAVLAWLDARREAKKVLAVHSRLTSRTL